MSKAVRIKDFPDYYVTDTGEVYSRKENRNPYGRIKKLKLNVASNGYVRVVFYKNDKKRYEKLVHRLVAEAFIPNLEARPEVNHIDGNPRNNNVKNLEWVSRQENALHAARVLGRIRSPLYWVGKTGKEHNRSKTVFQIKNGEIVGEFGSVMEANRKTGIDFRCISACCLGKRKTTSGYEWRYK